MGRDMQKLPNEETRRQLCAIVADAILSIRSLARSAGHEQIEDLADLFHNLPTEIYGHGKWDPDLMRGMIAEYEEKYGLDGWTEAFDEATRR
jgi:hypothetical protein